MEDKKPLVLIAEDDRGVAPILREIVEERLGARVRLVETATEAICPDAEVPVVVLTAIGLADGKTAGFGVVDHFVALGVPVVVVSGSPTSKVSAMQKGALVFIEKPFGAADLIRAIQPYLV